MEQNQESSLFEFGIDQSSRVHLSEAARWAKFLAIIGFIVCGLVLILGIFAGAFFSSLSSVYGNEYRSEAYSNGVVVAMLIFYVGFAILYFFPCLFLLRFANHMRNALNGNDQFTLNASFQNLKKMFRYVGILTIVVISLYVLAFLFAIITSASMGFR